MKLVMARRIGSDTEAEYGATRKAVPHSIITHSKQHHSVSEQHINGYGHIREIKTATEARTPTIRGRSILDGTPTLVQQLSVVIQVDIYIITELLITKRASESVQIALDGL